MLPNCPTWYKYLSSMYSKVSQSLVLLGKTYRVSDVSMPQNTSGPLLNLVPEGFSWPTRWRYKSMSRTF